MPVASLEIRRLHTCSFAEAVQAWNEGFQGYFVDMTLSLDGYLARLQREGLSPEHSFLAFSVGRPAGFLLNGIRENAGTKVAWNGGTGVSPEFRGQGVGRALMEATLDLYSREEVEIATLEAISENETAIALYRKYGYEVSDSLIFLEHEGSLKESWSPPGEASGFVVREVVPAVVGQLDFYRSCDAWQVQWQSLVLENGQALVVSDRVGVDVGYALYKKKFNEQGQLTGVALHQCEARPGRSDAADIVTAALERLYAPLESELQRSTFNLRKSNELVRHVLVAAGFSSFIEQVHMVRRNQSLSGAEVSTVTR